MQQHGIYETLLFEKGEMQFSGQIKYPADHPVYQGHFPQQPVVPGVMQIQTLRELTERFLGQKFFLNEVVSAKYLNMIIPGETAIHVEAVLKPKGEQLLVTAVFNNGETVFSKFKLKLSPEL